jgi:hypothetical protein
MIVATAQDGKLKRGIFCDLANEFKVAPSTIGRLWKSTLDCIDFFLSNHDLYEEAIDVSSLKFNWRRLPDAVYASGSVKNGNNKKSLQREQLKEMTRLVPLNKRKTYRSLARELKVSFSSIYRLLHHEKVFRRHTNDIKPSLTDENKLCRVEYVMDKIDPGTFQRTLRSGPKYQNLYDEVHIDEKWFFLMEEGARYILVDSEERPWRKFKHKKWLTKVMFLCVQARPRKLDNGTTWDGKIGI